MGGGDGKRRWQTYYNKRPNYKIWQNKIQNMFLSFMNRERLDMMDNKYKFAVNKLFRS